MNRRKLEKHLREHGCYFHHPGGKHDAWINPVTLKKTSVPRHSEVKTNTVKSICDVLQVPYPSEIKR